jgi:hypothetical protein
MSGINQRHVGVEFAAEVPIAWGVSFRTAVNLGQYLYTDNPTVTQTVDNSADKLLNNDLVYYKNLYVESTPQTAVNLGLNYRGANNWFAGIDLNIYDGLYLSMNPLYRTEKAFEPLRGTANEEQGIKDMMAQEKFPTAFVLNANVSKLWYIGSGQLGISLEAKNLLNNQGIKTGGYEQSRLYRDLDTEPYSRFNSKYFYLYGVNFYLNVYYRF